MMHHLKARIITRWFSGDDKVAATSCSYSSNAGYQHLNSDMIHNEVMIVTNTF